MHKAVEDAKPWRLVAHPRCSPLAMQRSQRDAGLDIGCHCRIKKTGSSGEQLKEAQAINKSLSALGDVISALASEAVHIPYRNHKLTMLMSDSLGGTAKTLMFVNVSPTDSNIDETQVRVWMLRGFGLLLLPGSSHAACCAVLVGPIKHWPSPPAPHAVSKRVLVKHAVARDTHTRVPAELASICHQGAHHQE